MEDDLNLSKMEDDLNFLEKGIQSKSPPPLLNSKPYPPILGLSTAQVMVFPLFSLLPQPPHYAILGRNNNCFEKLS